MTMRLARLYNLISLLFLALSLLVIIFVVIRLVGP
jgi:hypothetical protein